MKKNLLKKRLILLGAILLHLQNSTLKSAPVIDLPYPDNVKNQLKDKNTKLDLADECALSGVSFIDLFKDAKTNTIVVAAPLTYSNNILFPQYFNATSYKNYALSAKGDDILSSTTFYNLKNPYNNQNIIHSLFFTITYNPNNTTYTGAYIGDGKSVTESDQATAQFEGELLNNVDGGKKEKLEAQKKIVQKYRDYGNNQIAQLIQKIKIPEQQKLTSEDIKKMEEKAEELKKIMEIEEKKQEQLKIKTAMQLAIRIINPDPLADHQWGHDEDPTQTLKSLNLSAQQATRVVSAFMQEGKPEAAWKFINIYVDKIIPNSLDKDNIQTSLYIDFVSAIYDPLDMLPGNQKKEFIKELQSINFNNQELQNAVKNIILESNKPNNVGRNLLNLAQALKSI